MVYLVPKSGRRASHIWDGNDTACRMYSTGGMRRIDKYDVIGDWRAHRNHRRLCSMCQTNAKKAYQ